MKAFSLAVLATLVCSGCGGAPDGSLFAEASQAPPPSPVVAHDSGAGSVEDGAAPDAGPRIPPTNEAGSPTPVIIDSGSPPPATDSGTTVDATPPPPPPPPPPTSVALLLNCPFQWNGESILYTSTPDTGGQKVCGYLGTGTGCMDDICMFDEATDAAQCVLTFGPPAYGQTIGYDPVTHEVWFSDNAVIVNHAVTSWGSDVVTHPCNPQ